jgi:probable blue pigment (indigoidine) exporter
VNAATRARPRPGRMLLIAVGWGSCFVLLRWGLRDAPVLWFAALRALAAGVALLAAAAATRNEPAARAVPRGGTIWALIAVLGLVNVTAAFAAMFASSTGATTGVASVLANIQPLLVVLPAWWLYGERPRLGEMAGIAVGFGGLVLIAAPSGGGRGAGLALLAAAAIATGTLLARRLERVDVLALGAWQFLLGGAVLAGAALLTEGAPAIAWTPRFTAVLAALALGATALPYVLWFIELRRAPLAAVTAWTLLVPVVGVVLGVLVLGEGITLLGGIGDAVVVASLILVANSGRFAAHRRTR